MKSLIADDLRIEVTAKPRAIRLDWLGKSSDRRPSTFLTPFFDEIARSAAEGAKSIEMHFEQLLHFNSSTIATLIQLIQDLRTRQIKLVIVFDERIKWQKLSFDALRIFEKLDGLLGFQDASAPP